MHPDSQVISRKLQKALDQKDILQKKQWRTPAKKIPFPIGMSHQSRCRVQLDQHRSRLDGCHRKRLLHWHLHHQDLLATNKESINNTLWFDEKIETQQLTEVNEDAVAGI